MSDATTTAITLTKKNPEPISLTDAAIAKVAELIAGEQTDDVLALRVAVKPGGCSGFEYSLSLSAPEECLRVRSSIGKSEAEGRSLSEFGFDPDPPLIPFHDPLTDSQSNAGTRIFLAGM